MDMGSHKHGPCVLVIDDHDMSRQHTVQALRQITCHVKQAGSGQEALMMTAQFQPELIFLDLHLPDMDGLSLLHKIRQSWPEHDEKPAFAILTGDSSADSRPELWAVNPVAILTKPATKSQVANLVSLYLHQASGVREKREQPSTRKSPRNLRRIFMEDLETQCPLLDQHMSALDWDSAKGVLHQIIAGSAICRQEEIERHSRLLHDHLSQPDNLGQLAQVYYGLLRAIAHAGQSDQA